ncbi:MAG: restriction endonuclease [Thaumarchaeota archaeon]|nr:restriction endonuclease [Nitrososphaerota archaeon]MCZ6724626.1 restriction endonuclease [Nitrososphaerota archaeon]
MINPSAETMIARAIDQMKGGASIQDASRDLSWKNFEDFVSYILTLNGYETVTRHRVGRRAEIDIISWNHSLALIIDCKHWKKTSKSSLSSIVSKQIQRSKLLIEIKYFKGIRMELIPTIVTLVEEEGQLFSGVPIVPVQKFDTFLRELDGNLEMIYKLPNI